MVYTLSLDQAQVSIKIDRPFYYPGEIIKGVIYLKMKSDSINAGLLYIKLCGQEKVNQVDKYNQFFSFKQFFYKKQKKITNFGKKMPLVACKKYFEMEIPNLYPSFTINYYKQVQFSFQGEKETQLYKPPKRHRVVVHILQKPSPNAIHPISHKGELPGQKKCCFQTGVSKLDVSINKSSYVFGENIYIQLSIDNNESNVAISKIQFVISSQLIILYKEQKRKLSNYFLILQQELNQQIPAHSMKELETSIQLPIEMTNKKGSIYPQTTVKTKSIIYQYILTVNVIFQKSFLLNKPNLTVVLPILLFQPQKREPNNIIQSMDNLSVLHSQSIFDTQQKINSSLMRRIIYSDHNWSGYGEQDGYDGPERPYNPVESLDEAAFMGKKGALEQLQFKKQYQDQEGSEDEKLIEEIEGNCSSISSRQIQLQQPQTIFQQQNQQQQTIFNLKKANEIVQDEGKIDNGINDQLQTIKEEQDSKGTQYNLNHLSSSGFRRKNSEDPQFDQISNHHRVETFGPNMINNETEEQKQGYKIASILKNNKIDQNSSDQQQNQEQKDLKQLKVQFHEATSADTIDGKNGEKQTHSLLKNDKQSQK